MNRLSWLDDGSLNNAVTQLLERAKNAKQESAARITKNVVDPFSSLILTATFDLKKKERLSEVQKINSASSGINNAVGKFHQDILGAVGGFKNHDAGYDLECPGKKIIAEVKNKHNTMNATNRRKVEADLDTAIRQKSGTWKAYLVIIIPKKPERYEKRLLTKKEVYEIDGASFYALATGSNTAIHELYDAVQSIIKTRYQYSDDVLKYCETLLHKGIPK